MRLRVVAAEEAVTPRIIRIAKEIIEVTVTIISPFVFVEDISETHTLKNNFCVNAY